MTSRTMSSRLTPGPAFKQTLKRDLTFGLSRCHCCSAVAVVMIIILSEEDKKDYLLCVWVALTGLSACLA